jgi:TatA/E family protein of Tat protein translocase
VGSSRRRYHGSGMSLPDTIFIFALALVIFGPKKLPEIGRQIGKLVFEFRRASNEFKLQIEEELRSAEEADRKAKAAAQVSAPPAASVTAADLPEPQELTIRPPTTGTMVSAGSPTASIYEPASETVSSEGIQTEPIVSPQGVSEDRSEYPDGKLGEERNERSELNQAAGEPITNHHG